MDKPEILKLIRSKRAYYGFSQKVLAEKIGIGYGMYRMFETG
jgi:hypothetical protein